MYSCFATMQRAEMSSGSDAPPCWVPYVRAQSDWEQVVGDVTKGVTVGKTTKELDPQFAPPAASDKFWVSSFADEGARQHE